MVQKSQERVTCIITDCYNRTELITLSVLLMATILMQTKGAEKVFIELLCHILLQIKY